MKLDPTLPWDVMFDRAMQSWRDQAYSRPHDRMSADEPYCEKCRSDRYVAVAMQNDLRRDGDWPHWMFERLSWLIGDIRHELLTQILTRPHAEGTVKHYFYGSGLVPEHRQDLPTRQAVELVLDHGKVVDLWLLARLSHLGDWPERVRRAAARPR